MCQPRPWRLFRRSRHLLDRSSPRGQSRETSHPTVDRSRTLRSRWSNTLRHRQINNKHPHRVGYPQCVAFNCYLLGREKFQKFLRRLCRGWHADHMPNEQSGALFRVIVLVPRVMLVLAVFQMPYGFYTLLRLVVTAAAGDLAWHAVSNPVRPLWASVMGLIALQLIHAFQSIWRAIFG